MGWRNKKAQLEAAGSGFSNPTAPWGDGPLLVNGNMSRFNDNTIPRMVHVSMRQARWAKREDARVEHQRWVEDRRKAKRKRAQLAAAKAAGQPVLKPAQQDPGWFKAMLKALPSHLWASKATIKAEKELDELKIESLSTGKTVEELKIARHKKLLDEVRQKRAAK